MNKKSLSLMAAAGLLAALVPLGSALAQSTYATARVQQVIPINETVRVSHPRQECWDEQIHHTDRGRNTAGMVVGGIAGGVVGNRFGGGRGKTAATVAGAVAGAAIGDRLMERPGRSWTTTETHCRVVDSWYEEERTVGYRVQYRYHGDSYWTEMDHHPGDRIRVRVDVTPVRY